MEKHPNIELFKSDSDDFAWAERSEYWCSRKPFVRGRPKKFKYREPLILCGHGVKLRVDHDTLFVQSGFTHYPQSREEFRFFPGDPNLPDRIIILDGSGGISFDALTWMAEQQITFVQLDWRGQISFVGGNAGISASRKLVDTQRATRATPKMVGMAQWLIREKIANSIKTIFEVIPKSTIREKAISKLKKSISEIENRNKSLSVVKIMGIEGDAAATYFRAWQGIPLKWSNPKRKPVPADWVKIGPRKMNWRDNSRNARHPINAMLNYGYGMLVSEVRTHVTAVGLDPSIGIMHGNKDNHIPLVYDLMEPLRPEVDRAILTFALTHAFSPDDFAINRWGGCRLNPQMAKAVAATVDLGNAPNTLAGRFVSKLVS